MHLKILPISAFKDNYIWAIIDQNNHLCVVDPGDAKPVIKFIDDNQLTLDTILITHHHHDHIGGVAELAEKYQPTIFGFENSNVANITYTVVDGDSIQLDKFNLTFTILEIPGHTLDHIAYYSPGILFCGDTLFSAGCGRVFEGTNEQMLNSLHSLANLPDDTMVYCAHEYTLSNLKFAQAVDPNNKLMLDYMEKVKKIRENNHPTLPSELKLEKEVNPFLRVSEPAVKMAAEQHVGYPLNTSVDVFTALREWKNTF